MDGNKKRFLKATRNGNLKTVDEMLKSKIIKPNQIIEDKLILSHAVENVKSHIVKYLIANGADVGHNNFEALIAAVRTEEASIVEIILDVIKSIGSEKVLIEAVFGFGNQGSGCCGDDQQATAFMLAINDGSEDIIRMFLDLVKDEHRSLFQMNWFFGDNGMGLYHYAYELKLETLEALIEKLPFSNELINLKDDEGRTPLHAWAELVEPKSQMDDHVKLLIKKGLADPNSIDNSGRSPLHSSMVNKCMGMTKAFLKSGCRMDTFDQNGDSPLKSALQMKRRKEIELLLAFGVDLQNEPYLYDEVEVPDRFKGDAFAKHRDSSRIHPDLLAIMRELRRSNDMNSLKYICRKSIRDHYKPNAEEIISEMNNIPPILKSFLLAENEEEVLALLIDWEYVFKLERLINE